MERPEPGWYPDPERPGQVRYYDGDDWTSHVRDVAPAETPADGPPPAATATDVGSTSDRAPSSTRSVLVVSFVLMVLVLAGSLFIGTLGSGGDDDREPDDVAPATGQDDGTAHSPDEFEATEDDADLDPPGDELTDGATDPDRGPDDEPDETAGPQPSPSDGRYDAPFELTIDPAASYLATIATSEGDIVLELDPVGAPVATNNLVNLAQDGYYDGIIFHRVIDGFVIQAGDPTATGAGGPGYRFEDELGPAEELVEAEGGYPRGTLAMANAGPDTNGSQFFIVQGDLVELPPLYTVFGRVSDGMDVVDAIATSPTGAGDRPVTDMTIDTIDVTER